MSPEDKQPKEYIITEDQLQRWQEYCYTPHDIASEARSRPVSTPPEGAAPEPIEGDRRICEHQEIKSYPGDEFTMCRFEGKYEFQHPSSVPPDIFCNKKIVSHDAAIAQAAREKVLEELNDRMYNEEVTEIFEVVDIMADLRQHKEQP